MSCAESDRQSTTSCLKDFNVIEDDIYCLLDLDDQKSFGFNIARAATDAKKMKKWRPQYFSILTVWLRDARIVRGVKHSNTKPWRRSFLRWCVGFCFCFVLIWFRRSDRVFAGALVWLLNGYFYHTLINFDVGEMVWNDTLLHGYPINWCHYLLLKINIFGTLILVGIVRNGL